MSIRRWGGKSGRNGPRVGNTAGREVEIWGVDPNMALRYRVSHWYRPHFVRTLFFYLNSHRPFGVAYRPFSVFSLPSSF
jgi:hypothetical protein